MHPVGFSSVLAYGVKSLKERIGFYTTHLFGGFS